MGDKEYHGHLTQNDGTHVPLTRDEANSLWESIEKSNAERRERIPDTEAALRLICDAKNTLREQGWSDACYCPKDGTTFAVIEFGSGGIFEVWYMGDWRDGRIYCCDYLQHPNGMMWKSFEKLSPEEKTKMDECMKREREAHVREIAGLIAADEEPPQ